MMFRATLKAKECACQSTAEIHPLALSAQWVASRDRQAGRSEGRSSAAAGSVSLTFQPPPRVARTRHRAYSGKTLADGRGGAEIGSEACGHARRDYAVVGGRPDASLNNDERVIAKIG
jgi:hypothetical protein